MASGIYGHMVPEEAIHLSVLNQAAKLTISRNGYWKKKLKKHFIHRYQQFINQENVNWYKEFWTTYQDEYKSVPKNLRRLFSIIKELDFTSLENFNLGINDLYAEDKNAISLQSLIEIVNDQTLNNYIFLQLVKAYSENGKINPLKKDKYGSTILHHAVMYQQPLNVIRQLIWQGCDPYAKSNNGSQAIHLASFYGRLDILQFFIEKYPELLDRKSDHGNTPLMWAAYKGHAPVVQFLIEKKADLFVTTKDKLNTEYSGCNALHWAICQNHVDVAKLLINTYPTLNYPLENNSKLNAIHMACKLGHLDIVKILLEKQPNLIDSLDLFGQSALSWAASNGHIEVVKYLIEKKANINVQNNANSNQGYTPLLFAISQGHTEVAEFLINSGADVSITSDNGIYPLHLACKRGLLNVVKLILEKHPELLNLQDWLGQTSLIWAADDGRTDVVRFLIDKNANLNLSNNYLSNYAGYTPLHWAAKSSWVKVVRLLAKHMSITRDARNKFPQDLTRNKYIQGLIELKKYSIDRDQQKEYKYSVTILGHSFFARSYRVLGREFNLSRTQKNAATHALKEVYFEDQSEDRLNDHKAAIKNGGLSNIYKKLRCKSGS